MFLVMCVITLDTQLIFFMEQRILFIFWKFLLNLYVLECNSKAFVKKFESKCVIIGVLSSTVGDIHIKNSSKRDISIYISESRTYRYATFAIHHAAMRPNKG